MTTIAYRDGILAADSQGDWGGTRTVADKIHRAPGVVIAGSGATWRIRMVVREIERLITANPHWLTSQGGYFWGVANAFYDPQHDRDSENTPSVLLIQVRTGTYMRLQGPIFTPCDLDRKFIAIGSGCEYALGAMAQGATAEEAVKIAASLDTYSGGPICAVNVRDIQYP